MELYEPDRRLRLFAEMNVPGHAWLEFRVEPDGTSTVIRQIAQFEPRGLTGMLYWYLLSPVHEIVFRGMLRRIASAALHPETLAGMGDVRGLPSARATGKNGNQ